MKTFAKIAAIAVIAVMAAVSCTPQAELTDFDWDTYNKQRNPSLNTGVEHDPIETVVSRLGVNPPVISTPPDVTNPRYNQEVEIEFYTSADVLRKSDSDILGALQRFLSFHHFTNANNPLNLGQASTLTEPGIPYTFVRRNDDVITVRLEKQFSDTESNVIMRISAANYTFSNGMRMDRDGNGIAGEAFYDDYLREIILSRQPGPGWDGGDFVAPENQGWAVNIGTVNVGPNFATGSEQTSGSHFNFPITHTVGFGGVGTLAENQNARNAILGGLASSLRLQRNNAATNWNWENVDATVEYDAVGDVFRIPAFNREHLTAYRIVYTGPTNLTTAAEYYGGRQRFRVYGGDPFVEDDRHDPGIVMGGSHFVWNYQQRVFVNTAPTVTVHSSDSMGQNVVLNIRFAAAPAAAGLLPSPPANRFLSNALTAADFIANFRLAYFNGSLGSAPANLTAFQEDENIGWINITAVEFVPLTMGDPGDTWDSSNFSGIRDVRVTLDPAYRINNFAKFIYVNDRIVFDGGLHTFGDPANWQHGFFQLFSLGSPF